MARRRRKPRTITHAVKVWGYPATEDTDGPIHWAWRCTGCGQGDQGMDEDAANQARDDHIPAEGSA